MNPSLADPHNSFEKELRAIFEDRIRLHVPLAPYTTLRIGGPAQFILEAFTEEDIILARQVSSRFEIPFVFLAGCSNVLVSDQGVRGLVVINRSQNIIWRHDDKTVLVDGGYDLDRLVSETAERGWADLTFSAGIPGTLGGALAGGAGAFGHLVHEYLIEAKLLRANGVIESATVEDLGVVYRDSLARQRGDIILQARMGGFNDGDAKALLEEIARIKALRETKHPHWDTPSAGSFFKNLPPTEPGGHRIPAGKYLDEAGAKGMRVGGAQVFEKHANIIINADGATAADVDELANRMAALVRDRFGIELQREVLYLK